MICLLLQKIIDTPLQKKTFHIILCLAIVTLLSSCSIRRFVPEGERFLDENKVVINNKPVEFTKSDINTYIIQKPFFKLGFTNRDPVKVYYQAQRHPNNKFLQWVNRHIGEEPEYFSYESAQQSTKQIEQYLNNRGYFNSKVSVETKVSKRRRKRHLIQAIYTVDASEPYRISKITCQVEDTVISKSLQRIEQRLPAKEGDVYNSYTLDDQRTFISNYLRNTGYYYFSKDYITYEVDSSFNNHTIEVTMKIANVKDKKTNETRPHKRYYINRINIYPDHSPFLANTPFTDSASITISNNFRNIPNTLNFYYHNKPYIRPSTFSQIIQIYQGRLYRQQQVSQTYSALSSLKIISNSSIEFDTVPSPNDTLNLLDCNITLRRSNPHSIKLQTEGTNSGGDLGISGSITYTNKNIFRGSELLLLSVKGGLEAQEVTDMFQVEQNERSVFNTRELIFTSSLNIPRFLSPIPLKTFVRDYQPKTTFSFGGSVQERFAYSRYITMGTFGYDWKANPRMQFIVTPFYLNFVKVNPIPEFQALLDQESNQRLKNQYTNHFIIAGRYSLIYNTQNIYRSNNYVYLRGNLETSGGLVSLFNGTSLLTTNGHHHELFGIRYAQYIRGDVDFRQYLRIGDKSWLVFRELIGAGIPYGNSFDMPFERSFYSGGSTGMRGWDYRKLGPGAYVPTDENVSIERIGDLQLELNAEVRFPIRNSMNGALFVDAGNIWNYHANEMLPDGEFHFNSFYQQLAVDAGLGIRFDFNIAVLRIDAALPIRYPYAIKNGKHWTANILDTHFVFNIGYPF